jgi:hypothetical protein
LARILLLRPCLSHFYQIYKTFFALSKTSGDSFLRVLRELFVLNNKVMKIVSQVISAGSAAMTIKNTEEANLGPFRVREALLRFWF